MSPAHILRPENTPELEDLATDEDNQPLFTNISHGLQAQNQLTLWRFVLDSGVKLPRGPILDAGCGDGLFLALAPEMVFPTLGTRQIIGVDRDRNKVRKARYVAARVQRKYAAETVSESKPGGHFIDMIVQEPQDLARLDTQTMHLSAPKDAAGRVANVADSYLISYADKDDSRALMDILARNENIVRIQVDYPEIRIMSATIPERRVRDQLKKEGYSIVPERRVQRQEYIVKPLPRAAMIWSNSMFHWLKDPTAKYAALNGFYQVLKEGGVLALSMSAGGTAADFLDAYRAIMNSIGPYGYHANPYGFLPEKFESDPIGSVPPEQITNMLKQSGFRVLASPNLEETVTYDHPLEYAAAVKVYGQNEFLGALPENTGQRTKDRVWKAIENAFMQRVQQKGWREGQPWAYDQRNTYLVAERLPLPKRYGEKGHEEKLLDTIFGKRTIQMEQMRRPGSSEN